jgi:hypothetical protein
VFLVACGDELRCAKVYKDADQRGFHQLAAYQEGRKTRGSRDERALRGGGRHGRELAETQWKNAEADALYKLDRAGVRVPKPFGMFDGVLIMELITGLFGLRKQTDGIADLRWRGIVKRNGLEATGSVAYTHVGSNEIARAFTHWSRLVIADAKLKRNHPKTQRQFGN